MKILYCGDVVGRSGREVVEKNIPELRKKHALDFVVVNGENSASGFGITREIYESLLRCGVDAVTGGDHIWDQKEMYSFINDCPKLLRPHNFPSATPGTGIKIFDAVNGKKVLVIHLLGQLFMKYTLESPFEVLEREMKKYTIGNHVHAIVVDIHAEATSEKMAIGHFLDGRVSMVVGSHTHVPTADAQIFPGGTAYQTDAGMCGDYDSIIGFDKKTSLKRFITKVNIERLTPAANEATLCGVIVETDDKTGLAKNVKPIRISGRIGE